MKEHIDITGKTISRTGAEAIRLLEMLISEGFLSGSSSSSMWTKNLFGRSAYEECGTDLSFLAGFSASGLRSSAFLSGPELADNQNQLMELSRQHLPVVVHYASSRKEIKFRSSLSSLNSLHLAAANGCFQLVASDLQEAVDLALMAHKVAERSLIPGICMLDGQGIAWKEGQVKIPSADQLRTFLGDPDGHILSPTPAQELIFGKDRRRIPHWFNLDTPVMSGLSKDALSINLEGAAQHRFFNHHLHTIIEEVMEEYKELSGRVIGSVQTHNTGKADYLILTAGHVFQQVKNTVDQLRTQDKMKIGCLNLSLLRPFPEKELAAALKGAKVVLVLEGYSGQEQGDAPLFKEVKAALSGISKKAPKLLSTLYGHAFSSESLKELVKNRIQKKEAIDRIFLGVDFTRDSSALPQHELLLQSIRRAYPDISGEAIHSTAAHAPSTSNRTYSMPFTIRQYRDEGPSFSRLSRFYHQTACFYQSGWTVELVADPYQALPLVPGATAGFSPVAENREKVPVFEPQNCTACGACFTFCPHSAIPPIALGLEAFIRGGMDIAAQQGTPVTGLTPMVKNLAKMASGILREKAEQLKYIRDFLPEAFQLLAKQMKLSGDRLEKAQSEMDILNNCIGEFPVAVTDTFFHQPEQIEKGSGTLFSLAIDPLSCTGCGMCVDICEEDALVMQASEKELEAQLLLTHRTWEQLPDTSSGTIRRMMHQETYDPFASILLSRNFYLSMIGGGTSEEGAAGKTMMHLLTALTESLVQSRVVQQIDEIQQRIKDLSDNIHHHLSNALPHDDFHLVVENIKENKQPLDAVIRSLQTEGQPKLIDTAVLQRKIALLDDLKVLLWELKEGPTGGGRARYGLSISAKQNVAWAEDYPYNPFTAPVIWHWDGAAPEKLKGLMLGWQRHLIDNVRLLRRAELEVKDKYRPEVHDLEIGHLDWGQLKEQEKQLLNPLFLIGDSQLFAQANSNGLLDLLLLDMPIKVVVLDAVNETRTAGLSRANTALFAAMSLRHAQILRGSLADSQALFDGLRDGIHSLQPALFHILTPAKESLVDHGGSWKQLADLALQTRAFTSFRYDPDIASGYMATDIRIDANPSSADNWVVGALHYTEGEEEKSKDYTWTYADWLLRQKAWQKHFRKPEAGETTVPIADFLNMAPSARNGQTPIVYSVGQDRQLEAYAADGAVVGATQNILRQWNSLREIAGALTPYPEKLQQQIEQSLREEYEQSLADLKASYEEKLKTQEQNMMEEVRRKLRDKLLALSKRGKTSQN
jgi:pyruvate/2-oxoacid:ferredoxin oxidoreductase alpha subunit/ferredoxin